jgi:serine/threonine-protein kinase
VRETRSPGLSTGTVFHGRYRVVRCLAAGGMGAVYEVMDERTAAPRALKVMLPGVVEDPAMRARFEQEARITGGIESEHLVRVLDAGVDEDTETPFLVMELLRGEDLGAILDARGALPPREVVGHLFQAALALDRTHAAGVVHRDLKPQNLFVTRRDDGSSCLKILDFGIAKATAQGGGKTSRSMGTPLYMAPEQAGGKGAIGPRADVYALAHVAYALLAGAPYWEEAYRASDTPLAFLAEVARGVREPASARAERRGVTLSAAFDGWFLKATAVDPSDRFATAGEAVRRLADALDVPLGDASVDRATPPDHAISTSPSTGAFTERVPEATVPDPTARTEPAPGSGTTGPVVSVAPKAAPRARLAAAGVLAGLAIAALLAVRWKIGWSAEGDAVQQTTEASLATRPSASAQPVSRPDPEPTASASAPRPVASTAPSASAPKAAVSARPIPALKPAPPNAPAPAPRPSSERESFF